MTENKPEMQEKSAETPIPEKKDDKKIVLPITLGVIFALLALGFFGWVIWNQSRTPDTVSTTTEDTTTESQTTDEATEDSAADPYAGWNTYTNPTYGYTFRYPSDWELAESEAEDCSDLPEDSGGCDEREEAAYVLVNKPNSDNRLIINYEPIGQIAYYDRDENAEEESFEVWGASHTKAYVYCNADGGSLSCTGGDAENIAFTEYFSDWLEGNPDGSSSGAMIDDCGEHWSPDELQLLEKTG